MNNLTIKDISNLFENNWYEKNIEKGVRELVFYLRNNGFNTECSCEHEKYVQCQYILDGEIMRLLNILSNYFHEKNIPCDYEVDIRIIVKDGHQYPTLNINF